MAYGKQALSASFAFALLRPKILPKIRRIRGKDRNLLVRCTCVWIRSSRPSLVPFRIAFGRLVVLRAIARS